MKLPGTVGFATAIDLGWKTGNVHSLRKQEVGRRLSLQLLSKVYDQPVVPGGPTVKTFHAIASHNEVTAVVGFDRASMLHTHGTGDCAITEFPKDAIPGDHECCAESPFQVGTAAGHWIRANFTIDGATVTVKATVPASSGAPTDLRYNHENFPQCALYNGVGGPDDHTGVAAAPFRMSLFSTCPPTTHACSGGVESLPVGAQCCANAQNETCVPNAGCYEVPHAGV